MDSAHVPGQGPVTLDVFRDKCSLCVNSRWPHGNSPSQLSLAWLEKQHVQSFRGMLTPFLEN